LKHLRTFLKLGLLGLLAAAGTAHAGEAATLRDLDALTARWMDLRGTLAEETRLWESRERRWREEIRLLNEEAEVLTRELESTRKTRDARESERAAVMARREKTLVELERLDAEVASVRSALALLSPRFPAPLLETFPVSPGALAESGGEGVPRIKGVQTLLAFLSGLEAAQNRFHAVRETVEIDGSRRQVDVLYLGMARAWGVSPDDTWAGTGTPGPDGWTWSSGGVEPEAARAALNVYRHQITAELVPLPLSVIGEAGE